MPKSAHPAAKKALAEIWNAENKKKARTAAKAFAALFGAKFPKAVAKITDDLDQLLAFYDYPAEHWIHLRTTNPIESTFATVRLRTKVTKGAGSKGSRARHGLQAHPGCRTPLAPGQRAPPGRARPRRSHLQRREARRTARRSGTGSKRHITTATDDELARAASLKFLIHRY